MQRNVVFREKSTLLPTLFALALVWPHCTRRLQPPVLCDHLDQATAGDAGENNVSDEASDDSDAWDEEWDTSFVRDVGRRDISDAQRAVYAQVPIPRRLPAELWDLVGLGFVLPLCMIDDHN